MDGINDAPALTAADAEQRAAAPMWPVNQPTQRGYTAGSETSPR
ncbi:hypothetical protein OOJ09_31275 [Mesorhizobium qingshengii]|uniref:Uncharacterized protein n=1 Tax=Mesorhizobium qingshengii TaxID=1165689 RepID=A0ABT4R4A4_9HYPH|nr:hypothetical protein [Mesorhizobium qingshengii]MCZ8548661.1 hypothetical protein [Mesorhizobium qingshengii]